VEGVGDEGVFFLESFFYRTYSEYEARYIVTGKTCSNLLALEASAEGNSARWIWNLFAAGMNIPRARNRMLEATDTKHAPWYIIGSDDKKKARLNCIKHLISLIPYRKAPRERAKLPSRKNKGSYDDQATLQGKHFVPEKY